MAGLVLGLAELTKFTLLLFYPLWITIWLIDRLADRQPGSRRRWSLELGQLTAVVAVSVLVINAGYGFEGSFRRLGDFRFQSWTMTGLGGPKVLANGSNRFGDTGLASIRVPLPANYLQGIDTQKVDFERGFRSYLGGQWKHGGWWYYYVYALAIKLPLGTWLLFVLAIVLPLCLSGYWISWRDELQLLLPAGAILLLVSSQTGFSIHSRYILPALPFLFVWMSKAARSIELCHWPAPIVVAALCWLTASSLWYFPHSLSYFNELVGGPEHGHEYLLDSNIGWGQDLNYLKDWLNRHPEASPLQFASFGWVDPRLAGVESTLPPLGPDDPVSAMSTADELLGPCPGWYAIDVNHLHSVGDAVVDEHADLQRPTTQQLNWHYFLHFRPVAMAGYSIYIYHVTLDEANRVRKELGLKPLSRSYSRDDCHDEGKLP